MIRRKIIPLKTGKHKHEDEQTDWLYLSPAERMQETTKLWQLYLALGGSLDSKPDPQSPFYFQKT